MSSPQNRRRPTAPTADEHGRNVRQRKERTIRQQQVPVYPSILQLQEFAGTDMGQRIPITMRQNVEQLIRDFVVGDDMNFANVQAIRNEMALYDESRETKEKAGDILERASTLPSDVIKKEILSYIPQYRTPPPPPPSSHRNLFGN